MILKFAQALAATMLSGLPLYAQSGSQFVPVTPCRVADTRNTAGPFGGPAMTANSTRTFTIPQSGCGVPTSAQAYALNVTVVPQGPLGFLTLWPAGRPQPTASTLNSWGGTIVANAAIVPAGTNGAVSVFASNPTDVVLDINGYFVASGSGNAFSFYPATPCRIADTRNAPGPFGGPSLGGGQTKDFPVPQASCAIPASASAYSLNVTAVPNGMLGYLTAWPSGQTQPYVSTLNSVTGKVTANAAIIPAGTSGSVSAFVTNPSDVVLDVNGYFGPSGGQGALLFYPVTPCRVADTRNANGPFGGPIMAANSTRSFAIPTSSCGIPATAAAYSMNVTVVPDGPLPYLTTWPTGVGQPYVSTLNSGDGSVVANAAIVPAGANGAISLFVTGDTHVVLDINGYFAVAGSGTSDVAERALAQTGLSIALASNVLQSQVYFMITTGTQSAACRAFDGGGSVDSGATPSTYSNSDPVYPVTVYYDDKCTQPYIAERATQMIVVNQDSGTIIETATYYAPNGATLGTMILNEVVTMTPSSNLVPNVEVHGLGSFTAANGVQPPVQLGLSCVIPSGATVLPCTGGIAQDFPALGIAIGSVTSLTLTISQDAQGHSTGVSFYGGGSTSTGPIGQLTLTNPSAPSFVLANGTPYTTTAASGSAAAYSLFPPTPTGWTLTDAGHDQQLQITVIDNTTRQLSLTITQISTGRTLVTGTLDQSGTGNLTYSDGRSAAITGWTLAD